MATLTDDGRSMRYNLVARVFHAVIALMIIFNLITGIGGESMEKVWVPYPAHKATGILILLLSAGRIVWRFTWTAPAWPATMGAVQRLIAKGTHLAFYALMLIVPFTGWIMSSASKYPIPIYGLFDWPKLAVAKDSALAGIAHEGHEILGFLMAGLVVLHVAAALHHHFIIKDNILRRMW